MKQRHQMQEEEEDVGTLSAGQQAIVGTLQMCVLLRELRTTNSDEKKRTKNQTNLEFTNSPRVAVQTFLHQIKTNQQVQQQKF